MKTDITTIQQSFHLGYDQFEDSRVLSSAVWDLYNGEQWTEEEKQVMINRGQPIEYFNVIRKYVRMLLGYFSTTVNTVQVRGQRTLDTDIASLMTDVVDHTFEMNSMDTEGDEFKKAMMLDGMAVMELYPEKTEETDEFGRPLYTIKMNHVPTNEVVIDPMSTKQDYSDARFIHRFKWISEEKVNEMFGKGTSKKLDDQSEANHLTVEEGEYTYKYSTTQREQWMQFKVYQIVHTVIEDNQGKVWSIYWCYREILKKEEITNRNYKWPYIVHRLEKQKKRYTEYYGIFKDIMGSQKAINQAIVKLQLMSNSKKVFVADNALSGTDLEKFKDAVNNVSGVVRVARLEGIQVEEMSRDVLDQYAIIDKALERIQQTLHINDSFLGQANASDSGRKVKIQSNSSILGLRYLNVALEKSWESFGKAIVGHVQQYFTAHQVFQISDNAVGQRFIELNKPIIDPNTGQIALEPVVNPDDNTFEVDEEGDIIFAPLPFIQTEPAGKKFNVKVISSSYADEDERSQLMLESVVNGPMGHWLQMVSPEHYALFGKLVLQYMKTKAGSEAARVFEDLYLQLGGDPAMSDAAAFLGGQASKNIDGKSRNAKLPSEGVTNV